MLLYNLFRYKKIFLSAAFSLKCYHCKLGKDCMDIQNTDATECGKIADSTHESRCIKKIIEGTRF